LCDRTPAIVCRGACSAVSSVQAIMSCSVPVARMELLDGLAISAVNAYSKTDFQPAPTLFFEFHGTEAGVKEQASLVNELTSDVGGSGFQWATLPEERARLWHARHTAYWASLATRPGLRGLPTDVCVPVSRLAEAVEGAQAAVMRHGVFAPLVGHVGDGNFHMLLMLDMDDPNSVANGKAASNAIVELALKMGGTCTGEHGIGHGKLGYLAKEHGPVPLTMMGAIKAALDPDNIMNPGKLGDGPLFGRP